MESNVIATTMPLIEKVPNIPGVLKVSEYKTKEKGVQITKQKQMKSSFGARFGHALMAGTNQSKLGLTLF